MRHRYCFPRLAGLMPLVFNFTVMIFASTSEKFSADGKGYVNVTLNLPTQPQSTSRAINDEFDHGVPDEYKVNDDTLILFAGADEATATFKAAYKLDGLKKELKQSKFQLTNKGSAD